MVQQEEKLKLLWYNCWTNKSKFTNNGLTNKYNYQYQTDHNSYWTCTVLSKCVSVQTALYHSFQKKERPSAKILLKHHNGNAEGK